MISDFTSLVRYKLENDEFFAFFVFYWIICDNLVQVQLFKSAYINASHWIIILITIYIVIIVESWIIFQMLLTVFRSQQNIHRRTWPSLGIDSFQRSSVRCLPRVSLRWSFRHQFVQATGFNCYQEPENSWRYCRMQNKSSSIYHRFSQERTLWYGKMRLENWSA